MEVDFSVKKGAETLETTVSNCAIDSVVVYTDRAEVKKRLTINLEGKNGVLLHGFPSWIDKDSIRLDVCVYTHVLNLFTIFMLVCH